MPSARSTRAVGWRRHSEETGSPEGRACSSTFSGGTPRHTFQPENPARRLKNPAHGVFGSTCRVFWSVREVFQSACRVFWSVHEVFWSACRVFWSALEVFWSACQVELPAHGGFFGVSGFQCGIAWKQALLILPFNPVEARQAGGANTRRAARRMRAVSGGHRDVPSRNAPPACASVTRSGTDGPTGWPSLVTFLATQESDPRKARNALGFGQCSRPESQSHTRFRMPFFCRHAERNRRRADSAKAGNTRRNTGASTLVE